MDPEDTACVVETFECWELEGRRERGRERERGKKEKNEEGKREDVEGGGGAREPIRKNNKNNKQQQHWRPFLNGIESIPKTFESEGALTYVSKLLLLTDETFCFRSKGLNLVLWRALCSP